MCLGKWCQRSDGVLIWTTGDEKHLVWIEEHRRNREKTGEGAKEVFKNGNVKLKCQKIIIMFNLLQ